MAFDTDERLNRDRRFRPRVSFGFGEVDRLAACEVMGKSISCIPSTGDDMLGLAEPLTELEDGWSE